ncbi:MAG: OmpA family protein [Methylococcales bacterium]|jgi:chemotaxis protein MotB|nr:OmpA family protein [Methylococcales bacterium]MBT7408247.1 OmpA family protein [Methylococcales bacterium]
MKLDNFQQESRLSLDMTPLIDVVFLLVLFFAVSTSFISPEKLEELKNALSSLKQEKTELTQQLSDYENKQSQLNNQIQQKEQSLDQHSSRIVIMDDKLKQLNQQLQSLTNQNRSKQNIINQKQDTILSTQNQLAEKETMINQTNKNMLQANTTIKQQSTDINSLNSKIIQLVDRYKTLSENNQSTQTSLKKLNSQHEAMTNLVNMRNLSIEQQNNEIKQKAAMLNQQKTDIESLNSRVVQLATQYKKVTTESDQTISGLNTVIASANKKILNYSTAKIQQTEKIKNLNSDLLRHQLKIQQLTQTNDANKDNEETLLENINNLSDENNDLEKQLAIYKNEAEKNAEKLSQINQARAGLNNNLKSYLTNNQLEINQQQDRLIIQLSDKILFDSGSSTLKSDGFELLKKVGKLLKNKMQGLEIQIGGHTDDVPIKNRQGLLSTNWGLSAARSVNVVRFFENEVGIPASYLSAVGYSQYRPVADNKTPQGRAINRRIEIVLLPKQKK